ncbi:hypothetical protein ZOSMA_92G00680 [Zostera marina]|uniref:DYW domain-containing protein n=1 Tax=Zostera marina TaxID=29655 RepID=A0A0K9NL69_ZOSMR|nr:hypothetical protein ZOSMA_92G00680 [Zostera marina]
MAVIPMPSITSAAEAMHRHVLLIKSGMATSDDNIYSLIGILTFIALHPSGDLSYARSIFDSLHFPNSYTANTMIRAYAKNPNTSSSADAALNFFINLQKHHPSPPPPDHFTFTFLLHACGRLRDGQIGRQIHGLGLKSGACENHRYVENSLIHMYGKCGLLEDGMKAFDRMSDRRDVVSWTSAIDGAAEGGRALEALQLFDTMTTEEGIQPNEITLISAICACSEVGSLSLGKTLHDIARANGFDLSPNIKTSLVDMYSKCGCLITAKEIFESITTKDVFAWTAMISAYAAHGFCGEAVKLFDEASSEVDADDRMYMAVLSACRNAGWVKECYRYLNSMKKKRSLRGGPKAEHYGCMVDLLSQIGRLDEAEIFIKGISPNPLQNINESDGGCYVEVNGQVYEFDNRSMQQQSTAAWYCWEEVKERLRVEQGYSCDFVEEEGEIVQSEKLAVGYGVMNAVAGERVMVVMKNKVGGCLCKKCHEVMKLVSKVYGREIIVRDPVRFHFFNYGLCSCQDFW